MKAKLALLTLLLLFAAGSLATQAPPQPPAPPVRAATPAPPVPPHDPVGENLFPPELVMGNQLAIGLEEAQKTYIRGEIIKAQTRFTELQWQLQDAMETMVSLLRQNQVDEQQVLAQLEKVLSTEREIKRTQITLMVRIKNKLTSDQQARLRELRNR